MSSNGQKMMFFIKVIFSKFEEIRYFLSLYTHSQWKTSFFCGVIEDCVKLLENNTCSVQVISKQLHNHSYMISNSMYIDWYVVYFPFSIFFHTPLPALYLLPCSFGWMYDDTIFNVFLCLMILWTTKLV